MKGSSQTKYITVFIPTYNGGQYIKECIDSILRQALPEGYSLELLIIDSGSTDNTLDVIKEYSDQVKLIEIPNSEFSHGGTRDKGAKLAKGKFVLFLSQDATPLGDRWLVNMIEPFFLSDKIGCVYGRQRPRQNAAATIKREVASVFGALGSPGNIVVSRSKSLVDGTVENEPNNFFSDVNSAARADLLKGPVPFRHVNYSEDQALAQDMLAKGYLKAYAPDGIVWHSNQYTARQYYHRKVEEFTGLHASTGYRLVASKKSLLLGWIRPTRLDWKFIWNDQEYKSFSKIVWIIESPFYNYANNAALYFTAKKLAKN